MSAVPKLPWDNMNVAFIAEMSNTDKTHTDCTVTKDILSTTIPQHGGPEPIRGDWIMGYF